MKGGPCHPTVLERPEYEPKAGSCVEASELTWVPRRSADTHPPLPSKETTGHLAGEARTGPRVPEARSGGRVLPGSSRARSPRAHGHQAQAWGSSAQENEPGDPWARPSTPQNTQTADYPSFHSLAPQRLEAKQTHFPTERGRHAGLAAAPLSVGGTGSPGAGR